MNTTVEQLKPCPFCGGEAYFDAGYLFDRVKCRDITCNASGPSVIGITREQAIAAWDTRFAEQSEVQDA